MVNVARAQGPVAELMRGVSKFWWLWLVAGIFWIIAALVVLQFDQASITTVGVLIGILFLVTAVEQAVIGTLTPGGWKWFFYVFSVLFAAAGIISLIHPKNTFAGVADILGFLFLIAGTFWIIQAFGERAYSSTWWLTLIAGIAMIILAFWTDGQFFVTKAYTLLIFAGIWALMQGVTDLVRAFEIRSLREL
jgi:uncharacterized membrane protein HdeD (DUF308 family)